MSGFTPGDWEYIATTETVWAGTPGFRDHVIVSKCGESTLIPREAREANGRLIAAAKDLFAALVALMDGEGEVHDRVIAARAAISKARGDGA